MIKELAIFRLRAGEGHRFETAFAGVVTQLTGADGYLKHRLVPTLDDAEVYILEVDWRDLASHIQGFEPSEAHERFISALAPLLAGEPVVIHLPTRPRSP